MSLSILVFTRGDAFAPPFLADMWPLSRSLGAELVIAGDGDAGMALAQRFADVAVPVHCDRIQETEIARASGFCRGEWVLKLDDDDSLSPALIDFLRRYNWQTAGPKAYAFPYAWLWGDHKHFITSPPFWPDPHPRLMVKGEMARWPTGVHQNHPASSVLMPLALLHHKFLAKTLDERREVAARYDSLQQGAGTGEHYGKFSLPELYCETLTVREVGDGNVGLNEWTGTGETVKVEKI